MHAVGSGIVARLRTFWPMLAGIICARTALIVACYGSYSSTDNGVFTDGAMLVVCGIFAVLLLVLWRTKRNLPENVVQVAFAVSVAVAAGCSIALSLVDSTDETVLAEGFVLSVVSTLALSLCMFYWLRNLRGADEVTAALFVFAAFMVSVAVVYLLSFLPTRAQNIVGAVLIVAQLVLMGPAAARRADLAGRGHRRARTFFTFARSHMQDARFLTACTVGMGALSFVDGFLRGYPDGLPIAFTPATRAAYSALAIAVCAFMVVLVVRRRERVMTVAIFVVMELLASLGLVLFGAFPFHWEIGAVAVNTLNIVICAYCFYVIIAFTSFGARDPYLYAMGGWVVCFGVRSVGRMLLYLVYPLTGNDILVNSVLGALILVSAQVVLIQPRQARALVRVRRHQVQEGLVAMAVHDPGVAGGQLLVQRVDLLRVRHPQRHADELMLRDLRGVHLHEVRQDLRAGPAGAVGEAHVVGVQGGAVHGDAGLLRHPPHHLLHHLTRQGLGAQHPEVRVRDDGARVRHVVVEAQARALQGVAGGGDGLAGGAHRQIPGLLPGADRVDALLRDPQVEDQSAVQIEGHQLGCHEAVLCARGGCPLPG